MAELFELFGDLLAAIGALLTLFGAVGGAVGGALLGVVFGLVDVGLARGTDVLVDRIVG